MTAPLVLPTTPAPDPTGLTLIVIMALLGGGAMYGFFKTKTPGFGRYNTSILVIILALSFSSMALVAGAMREQVFSSLLMAVVGFAGGMVAGKDRL